VRCLSPLCFALTAVLRPFDHLLHSGPKSHENWKSSNRLTNSTVLWREPPCPANHQNWRIKKPLTNSTASWNRLPAHDCWPAALPFPALQRRAATEGWSAEATPTERKLELAGGPAAPCSPATGSDRRLVGSGNTNRAEARTGWRPCRPRTGRRPCRRYATPLQRPVRICGDDPIHNS
jgi:hypothetical protein